MPVRWIINPVVETPLDGRPARRPRVSECIDPGRAGPEGEPKAYEHVTTYGAESWCLSKVRGEDLSGLPPECVDVLEEDYTDDGERTIGELGWSAGKLARVRSRLAARGVDTSGYDAATPLWRMVVDLMRRLDPEMTRARLSQHRIRGA